MLPLSQTRPHCLPWSLGSIVLTIVSINRHSGARALSDLTWQHWCYELERELHEGWDLLLFCSQLCATGSRTVPITGAKYKPIDCGWMNEQTTQGYLPIQEKPSQVLQDQGPGLPGL